MVVTVNNLDELQEALRVRAEGTPVVVNFSQTDVNCVWCKRFAPHFDKASEQLYVPFVKAYLDEWGSEEFIKVTDTFRIKATPTVLLFETDMEKLPVELKERTVIPLLKEINGHLS